MSHKLLLADDSVTIQKVIELTFADEDIEVIAVSNGAQAISIAPIERPDIVLADVGMPERDGYEVAAFIKRTPSLSHVPVLLLTGAFEPIDEGRAKAAGCDGVLVKPFEPQMVISRVKDLIAGRRPLTTPGAPGPVPVVRPPAPPAPTVPADEYFNRLGATFGAHDDAKTGGAGPTPADLGRELAGWQPEPSSPAATPKSPTPPRVSSAEPPPAAAGHPDVSAAADTHTGSALAPSASVPAPAASAPAPSSPVPAPSASVPARPAKAPAPAAPAPAPSVSEPVPTLAQAFAALLAAEQGKVPPPPPISEQALREEVIEQVTRKVIERMTDQVVREVVLDVADRLVREEIGRIKGSAR